VPVAAGMRSESVGKGKALGVLEAMQKGLDQVRR
jgi:hypothetical protein